MSNIPRPPAPEMDGFQMGQIVQCGDLRGVIDDIYYSGEAHICFLSSEEEITEEGRFVLLSDCVFEKWYEPPQTEESP